MYFPFAENVAQEIVFWFSMGDAIGFPVATSHS
jgi:hypothetical protein